MSTPPRPPPPEPPSFLPKPEPRSKLKSVLVVLAVFFGIVGLVLLVGVGLIWATCRGLDKL